MTNVLDVVCLLRHIVEYQVPGMLQARTDIRADYYYYYYLCIRVWVNNATKYRYYCSCSDVRSMC